MKKKRLSKQQLREKQKLNDKKFNRTMLLSFSILLFSVLSVLIFYTYRCDTRFAWFKHEVPANWICMNGDNLQIHESTKSEYKGETYYFCSQSCFNHLVKHFNEVAYTTDPVSGDTLLKANTIIGLKKRDKTEVAYFKNKQNFKKYYESK